VGSGSGRVRVRERDKKDKSKDKTRQGKRQEEEGQDKVRVRFRVQVRAGVRVRQRRAKPSQAKTGHESTRQCSTRHDSSTIQYKTTAVTSHPFCSHPCGPATLPPPKTLNRTLYTLTIILTLPLTLTHFTKTQRIYIIHLWLPPWGSPLQLQRTSLLPVKIHLSP
jgi:hypothetical protein